MSTRLCLSKLSAAVSIGLKVIIGLYFQVLWLGWLPGISRDQSPDYEFSLFFFFLNLLDLPNVLPEFFFGLAVLHLAVLFERDREYPGRSVLSPFFS